VLRPGGAVNWLDRIEDWTAQMPQFIPRGGRALVVPALYQTLERGSGSEITAMSMRERIERQVKDVSRTLDYLETRTDIDPTMIAYMGVSAGSEYGAIYLAAENRFATAVLVAGGFHDEHMLDEPEEANPWHYAPRVSLPVLMINGEHDFTLPVELAQKPMFELLGTPAEHKRHVILDGGHITSNRTGMARETLAWLDRYVGRPEASDSDGVPSSR
jgi:dienelactone hydrolase